MTCNFESLREEYRVRVNISYNFIVLKVTFTELLRRSLLEKWRQHPRDQNSIFQKDRNGLKSPPRSSISRRTSQLPRTGSPSHRVAELGDVLHKHVQEGTGYGHDAGRVTRRHIRVAYVEIVRGHVCVRRERGQRVEGGAVFHSVQE